MSTNRTALITGANRGLGFEVAKGLVDAGQRVFLGVRDPSKGEAAADLLRALGGTVDVILLDVVDSASVHAAADILAHRTDQLDVLVNNAGVSFDWSTTPSQTSEDLLRRTFEPNFFGAVALTQVLLPLLLRSGSGRIVNVSSSLGSLTCASDPAYQYYGFNAFAYTASKAALNAWTVALAKELGTTPIKVNSADPGWCRTELGGEQAPLDPAEGARAILHLALLPDDGPSGGFFNGSEPVRW